MQHARQRPSTKETQRPSTNSGLSAAPRVALLLLALAMVPLTGAGWFAAQELNSVRSSRNYAEAVERDTRELVRLTNLRASLLDERNWRLAAIGVAETGLSVEVIESFIGVNLIVEWDDSIARVDQFTAEIADPTIDTLLSSARQEVSTDVKTMNERYDEIGTYIDMQAQFAFEEILGVAGELPDGAELISTARVLEAAAATRSSLALQLSSYFGARFYGLDLAGEELRVLVQQQIVYENAVAQIDLTAEPGSQAAVQMEVLAASDAVDIFRSTLDALALADQVEETEDRVGGFGFIAEDLAGVALEFQSGTTSASLHLDLVTAAGNDVFASSQLLTARADAETNQAMASIGLLALLSIGFAGALARFIARPLQLLAESAIRLSEGDDVANIQPTGPREVRAAASALNDASASILLAERQADALASGDLTAPVLGESAAGQLGASLREAVQTLTKSLTDREEFRLRLAHEVSHDGLTQLPNRKACLEELAEGLKRYEASASTLAVVLIDLDGFKAINDQFGHPSGDLVLETVAARIQNGVRGTDYVGRLGGDEFVVIAEPVDDAAETLVQAQRLLEAVSAPISIGKASVRLSASIGIAAADNASTTADDLLRDADLALERAKSNGRRQIVVCDEALRALLAEQDKLGHALRNAIATDELSLFYQPIVDPNTGTPVGLEALIRWVRPGIGMTPPDSFIPFAERSDLIIDVDCWVMSRVARQLAEWSEQFGPESLVPVSINISGRHLSVDAFVDDIMGPLETYGIDPCMIVVEVTESALLDDLGGAAAKLQSLRDSGIKIAIDDFGTGYTSLAHLKTLPFDILKIDQSFTNDNSSVSLVKLIIDTGHLLGVTITSEGIETEVQARSLASMGSDDLQGYFYGRPCPPEEISLSTQAHRSEVTQPEG